MGNQYNIDLSDAWGTGDGDMYEPARLGLSCTGMVSNGIWSMI